MNRFLMVLGLVFFGMYFIGVAINAYLDFNREDDDWEDFKTPKSNTEQEKEETQAFIRTEKLEWDFVQYSERPFVPTSKNFEIELEINQTNLNNSDEANN